MSESKDFNFDVRLRTLKALERIADALENLSLMYIRRNASQLCYDEGQIIQERAIK